MGMVNLTINNKKVSVPEGTSILHAAKQTGITIPNLCYHPDQEVKANCRVCVVEVEGSKTLQASCATAVKEGMVVRTNTKKVRDSRKVVIELLLAN
ncbi:MAG TPA: 2Fe-2S iron-sulfur cluster-binding protein, partial [Clostridia bacterium]|nr:2Fe-2S iron-sulfur cluster-binding protein [Clostridia bacterium]